MDNLWKESPGRRSRNTIGDAKDHEWPHFELKQGLEGGTESELGVDFARRIPHLAKPRNKLLFRREPPALLWGLGDEKAVCKS